jgi:hypothetical protein
MMGIDVGLMIDDDRARREVVVIRDRLSWRARGELGRAADTERMTAVAELRLLQSRIIEAGAWRARGVLGRLRWLLFGR